MQRIAKSRVTVDFPLPERDILELLCEQDYRPPQEQIRWLVINAAKERGIDQKKDGVTSLGNLDTVFVNGNPS